MTFESFPSKLLEDAVNEFAKLPGIGRKTALRLVLHLLKLEVAEVNQFGEAIIRLRNEVSYCPKCQNLSDGGLCVICSDRKRDSSVVCVVESVKDVLAIENTHQFNGLYHVLGGIISPMNGIGPSDLTIGKLEQRVAEGGVKEVIMALSATMEGDTTNFFIFRKLSKFDLKMSTIARGVSVGDELEYTDEITLGRSILNRVPFEISKNGL
jgi:recombination protein RecR